MLLFANSLDGVRGGLVSGIQPAMGGLEGISRVGRTLGTPDAHPICKKNHVGTSARSCPAERSSAPCPALLSAFINTSLHAGRRSPSRIEHGPSSACTL